MAVVTFALDGTLQFRLFSSLEFAFGGPGFALRFGVGRRCALRSALPFIWPFISIKNGHIRRFSSLELLFC